MRSLLLLPLALLLSCQTGTVAKQDTTDAKTTDADADGHASIDDGGDDCDDADLTVYPGATETPYDGLDQDCDGSDLIDVDGDGFAAIKAGGDDCDDTDPKVYPDAGETPHDGLDQDCDGADLVDVDGDGYVAVEAAGNDCDDADSSIHPGAKETWYDGIDQDCDGNDCDSDLDGRSSALCGGDDCDDAEPTIYPGATEVPYDSIDQDCDGLDLVDVDGDGSAAKEAGGDDCDDAEASAHPGGLESRGDEVDNDCDGRVDEYVVCADASGDFTTIQEGVDGTPDGGTIEICPGVYAERVDIEDRVLTIEGAGEMPEDVMVDATARPDGIWLTGATTDVQLSWMGFAGDDDDDILVCGVDSNLRLERLYFGGLDGCGAGDVYIGEATTPFHAAIVNSLFESCDEERDLRVRVYTGGEVEISSNVFSDGLRWNIGMGETGRLSFHNNIIEDGTVNFRGLSNNSYTRGYVWIYNNSFVALDEFGVFQYVSDPCTWPVEPPTLRIESNVFADVTSWYSDVDFDISALLEVAQVDYSCFEIPPVDTYSIGRNLLWNIPDGLYQVQNYVATYTTGFSYYYDYSDEVLARSIVADPLFEYTADRGTYTPSVKSPCIDAGHGDFDADGSTNDIGAFGGPDGEWWKEFPWAIP